MKKAISLILSIIMLLSITAGLDFSAYADEVEKSGSCGNNATYYFDSSTGVLTIEGIGAIDDYGHNEAPWYMFSESIKKVSIKEGITIIGEHAFESCALYDLELPSTLTKINNWAFYGASHVENVYISDLEVKPSATSEIAEIYAEDVTANYGDEITIPIYIENNHRLMGYRLDFKYDTSLLQPISATCGADFSSGGQFNDSIGVKNGEFKVIWNNVDEKYANGILLNLKFKVLTDEKIKTAIVMNYSQPDTFNEKYEDVVFNCKDISVSLNNHQHSYTAVVTEPTCTEKGYTTYTCSCGDTYNDNEIPALGHSYGQWTYNGDAEYISANDYKNGTKTRICLVCGEEETVEALNTALLRRRGNALELESAVKVNVFIAKTTVDYYDEVYAEFDFEGDIKNVYAFKTYNSTYYQFDFEGIAPQRMSDTIKITFYGIKDGVKYWGTTYTYSITDYLVKQISSTTNARYKTMLVDLLYYGAACQTYQNYKTDSLMTDLITEEQKACRSTDKLTYANIKNASYATCENRYVRFGTALRLYSAVEMALALNISNGIDINDLEFKVQIEGRDLTYSMAETPENFAYTGGYWYFYFDGVYANQLSAPVYIIAYLNGEQVSYTLQYSVESYAATNTDSALQVVLDAMMHYGNSAKAYAGK